MKTKNILLIFFLLIISSEAFSQLKVGLRVGITSSTIKASEFTTPDSILVETLSNVKVGLQGGLMVRLTISTFFIQPEVLISSTGGEVRIKDLGNGSTNTRTQRFTKLDIPVMIGTKLGPLRLQVGPIASVILNRSNEAIDFSSRNVENKYHNATFGYQAGLGFDIKKRVAIDLKYEGNLSSLGNGVVIGGTKYKFDTRNTQWILGIGVFF